MEYSLNEKYAIIYVLWEIMKADGIIDEREKAFMNKIYTDLEISVKELQNIIDLDLAQVRIVLKSMSDEKKTEVNKIFNDMCACDGYVDKRETDVINLIYY